MSTASQKKAAAMAASIPTMPETLALIWVLWSIALGMIAFRITFQWRLYRRLYAGDYFVMLGMVTFTALTAVVTITMPHGYFMANYFISLAQDPSTPPPLPLEQINERSVVALKYTFSLLPLFWTTVWSDGCSRPEDFGRQNQTIRFATAADITSDLLTMILPLHLLRNLTVTKLQKLWLVTVFSLSIIIIAVALVRLMQVVEATEESKHDLLAGVRMLLARSLWSQIESMVALIVAALPALRFIGKQRIVKDKVPNSYGLVTIGGTGRSRPRPWELDECGDDLASRHSSQTELDKASVKSSYGISNPPLDRTATGQSTRPGTEADGESQSVRRCV
ncbi:hypothetical protein E4U42_002918 [Claviceps africana]|uniref:Rhodopsin domain-containing protein n=1 Tax=Claviceps africana TaxID=83212 RepID=A0A8K0J7Y2_9HYPO|nr:hypothetical protein E4U42_002918 [Claviceps africana]